MKAVAAALAGRTSFVVADRQSSAGLRHHGVSAYARYNPKFHETTRSRIFTLGAQTSLLLPAALKPELLRMAKASGLENEVRIKDISEYVLVEFSGPTDGVAWLWNGHFPLHADGTTEPRWY